jgi:hypothetical protein
MDFIVGSCLDKEGLEVRLVEDFCFYFLLTKLYINRDFHKKIIHFFNELLYAHLRDFQNSKKNPEGTNFRLLCSYR